jgi:3-hydroxy acid dehydrogenase/malonic semialdehyde reductase
MIILVTGATAGFGLSIARRFAGGGARVIAAGRRAERLEALRDELGAERVWPLVLDVRDRAAVEAAIAGLPPEWAAIDVCVNNAGLARGLAPAQEADLDDWDAMVDTNVKGLMYVTRAVLPGHGGARPRPRGQYRLHGGRVPLSWRQRLWRHQGLRAPVLAEPARRLMGHAGARHRHRAGPRRRHRVQQCPLRGDDARAASIYAGAEPLTPEDVTEAVHWVTHLPARVNINVLQMMPVGQSFGPLRVDKKGG